MIKLAQFGIEINDSTTFGIEISDSTTQFRPAIQL
jgi:hypothetical protein